MTNPQKMVSSGATLDPIRLQLYDIYGRHMYFDQFSMIQVSIRKFDRELLYREDPVADSNPVPLLQNFDRDEYTGKLINMETAHMASFDTADTELLKV